MLSMMPSMMREGSASEALTGVLFNSTPMAKIKANRALNEILVLLCFIFTFTRNENEREEREKSKNGKGGNAVVAGLGSFGKLP